MPQDLVDGLRPHEVAMATSGCLVKLETRLGPAPAANAADLQAVVVESSRRYAQPEDSESSPWLVSQNEVEIVLGTLTKGPQTREELAAGSALPVDRFDAALVLATAQGDVERESGKGSFQLTVRGSIHLKALRARRNEGEDHCGLLADTGSFLVPLGPQMEVVAQEGGFLRPDGEFEWRGRNYSVEVECSTVVSRLDQVARNIRKALAEERRCLIAVPDREMAERLALALPRLVPEAQLWKELGLLWREAVHKMVPYAAVARRPWGFLPGGADEEEEATADSDEESLSKRVIGSAAEDPLATDLARVYDCAKRLHIAGRTLVTATDFKELTEGDNGSSLTLRRLGMALSSLGVRSQRVMRNGVQVREYDLRTLFGNLGPRGAYPGDPTGRDPKDSSVES